MKKLLLLISFLLSIGQAYSQTGPLESALVLVARLGTPTTVNDSTYSTSAVVPADQLGLNYNATQVVVGDILVDQLRRLFRISSISAQTAGNITFQCVELQDNNIPPIGIGEIWRDDGTTIIPIAPANTAGISDQLQAQLLIHNQQRLKEMIADTTAYLLSLIDLILADTTTITTKIYCPSHGISLSSYVGQVAAFRGNDCGLANALSADSLQTGYVVDSVDVDTVLFQVSGLVYRPAHGLTVGQAYNLQDSPNGQSGISEGTVPSRTFVVFDENYLQLVDPAGSGAQLEIPVVNIPAAAFSVYGTDAKSPTDTAVQNIAEIYAAAEVIRAGSYLIAYNAAISDNEIYRNNADGSSTPFHVWQWNGTKVTRISSRPVAISTQDTLYGSSGLLPLDTIVPAGGIPSTAEVVAWLENNYDNNGLRLPNGSIIYFPGSGTAAEPDASWTIIDDLSATGGTNFSRIVKKLSTSSSDLHIAYLDDTTGDDTRATPGVISLPYQTWDAMASDVSTQRLFLNGDFTGSTTLSGTRYVTFAPGSSLTQSGTSALFSTGDNENLIIRGKPNITTQLDNSTFSFFGDSYTYVENTSVMDLELGNVDFNLTNVTTYGRNLFGDFVGDKFIFKADSVIGNGNAIIGRLTANISEIDIKSLNWSTNTHTQSVQDAFVIYRPSFPVGLDNSHHTFTVDRYYQPSTSTEAKRGPLAFSYAGSDNLYTGFSWVGNFGIIEDLSAPTFRTYNSGHNGTTFDVVFSADYTDCNFEFNIQEIKGTFLTNVTDLPDFINTSITYNIGKAVVLDRLFDAHASSDWDADSRVRINCDYCVGEQQGIIGIHSQDADDVLEINGYFESTVVGQDPIYCESNFDVYDATIIVADPANDYAISSDVPITVTVYGCLYTNAENVDPDVTMVYLTCSPDSTNAAVNITYDNSSTSLTATNVQDAIDEVEGIIPGVNSQNAYYVSTTGDDGTAEVGNQFKPWVSPRTAATQGVGVGNIIVYQPGDYIISETGTDFLTYDNSTYESASLIPDEQGTYNLYFPPGAKVDMRAESSSFYPGAFYIPNDSTTRLNIYGEGDFQLSNSQYNSLFWLGNDARAYIRGKSFTIAEETSSSQYSAFNRNAVRFFDFKCDYFYHAGVDFVSSYQMEDSADYRIEVDNMLMIADVGGDNSSPRIWLHYGRVDLDTVDLVREHYYIGSLGYDYESVGSPFCTPIFIGGSGKRGLVKNYEGSLTIDRFDLLDEKDFSIRYETEIAGFIERPEDGDTTNDDVIFDKTRIYKDSKFDIDIGTINSRQTQGYYCNSIFDNTDMTIRIDEAFVESMAIVFTDLQVTNNSTIIVDCGYCETFDRQTLIFSGSIDATSKVIIRGTYASESSDFPVFSINQTGPGQLIFEDVTLLSTGDTTAINSYTGSSDIYVKNFAYEGFIDDDNTNFIYLEDHISIDPGVAYVSSTGNDNSAQVGSVYKKFNSIAEAWEAIQAAGVNGTIEAQNETYLYSGPWTTDDDNFIQPTNGAQVVFKTDGEIKLTGYPWIKGPISDLAETSTWVPSTTNGPVDIVFDMPNGVLNIDSDASARVAVSIADIDSRVNGHINKFTCNDGESARWFGFYLGCGEFDLRIDTLDVQSGVGFNFWYGTTSSGIPDTLRNRKMNADIGYIGHNTTNTSDDEFIRYQPGTSGGTGQRSDIGSQYTFNAEVFEDFTVTPSISEIYFSIHPSENVEFYMEDVRFDWATEKLINPNFDQGFITYDMRDTSQDCTFNFRFGEIINGSGELFNSRSNSIAVDWIANDTELNLTVDKANFISGGEVLFNDTKILGESIININLNNYHVPAKAVDMSLALEFSDETVITISGSMYSTGANAVIDLDDINANTTVILEDVYLENDGSVPAVSSSIARTVYIRGSFYTEDSGDDPDITYVFLDRNRNHYTGFTSYSSDPSATLAPQAGQVYYFDTTSAGWTQEFSDANLKPGDSFLAYFLSTDTNTLTLDSTNGGFIRPNVNGDTAADATEDITTLGQIEFVWTGADFLMIE